MIFNKVNHVAIIVSDLKASEDFYINKLGLKIINKVERSERRSTIVYLDAGNIVLELFSFPDPPKRLSYPEATGLRHLAFEVDDFGKVIKRLKELGVEIEPTRRDEKTRKRITFFKDPDDLPIEISER